MCRGLLDGLQEGIECALGEHVDLIDDIDLELGPRRHEVDFAKDRPDVIDTVVGSGVHLNDIEDGTVEDALACGAFVAGIAVYRVFAVDCSRKDLGDRGLARSVLSAEKICMREPSADDCLTERSHRSFLSDDVIKCKRSELPVEHYMFFHKLCPRANQTQNENSSRPNCRRTRLTRGARMKSAYCCFLPDLTGFTVQRRTGP